MSDRIASYMLAACSLLAILAISMHPTVHARKAADMLQGAVAAGPMDRGVHAVLMVLLFAMVFALATYTVGRLRGATLAAFIAYATGIGSVLFATLIDGFFTPAFAKVAIGTGAMGETAGIAVLSAGAVAIQIATKFGLIAMSIAMLLWSVDLAVDRENRSRIVGVGGLVAGIAIIALTITAGRFNPRSLMVVVAVQALWYLAIAWLLYRRSQLLKA